MAGNHQKTLTRLETSTMVLATWLTNKSHQSRRIVQNSYLGLMRHQGQGGLQPSPHENTNHKQGIR